MIKEILYGGVTTTPDDYLCKDGDLAVATNLISEEGSLYAAPAHSVICKLPTDCKLLFIHKQPSYVHYIFIDCNGFIFYINESDLKMDASLYPQFPDEDYIIDHLSLSGDYFEVVKSITSIGNTLVYVAEGCMHYAIFVDDSYKYLGTHMPETSIQFSLKGIMKKSETFSIKLSEPIDISEDAREDNIVDAGEKNSDIFTNILTAKVASFIREKATDKGRFIYPFFVRYAYRLYDGSYTMHSSPCLMLASLDIAPMVVTETECDNVSSLSGTLEKVRVLGVVSDLYAKAASEQLESLKHWSDIIKSIDVFVTDSIYTYKAGERITKFMPSAYNMGYAASFCIPIDENDNEIPYDAQHGVNGKLYNYPTLLRTTKRGGRLESVDVRSIIPLPRPSSDSLNDSFENASSFFLLKSFLIEDESINDLFSSDFVKIEVPNDYLQSLTNRQQLPDEYMSHDAFLPKSIYIYNGRLNMCNIERRIVNKDLVRQMYQYAKGDLTHSFAVTMTFYIKEDAKDIIITSNTEIIDIPVVASSYDYLTVSKHPYYIYYPNPNAYKVIIKLEDKNDNTTQYVDLPLRQHAFLSGAYFFIGSQNFYFPTIKPIDEPVIVDTTDPVVHFPNRIYTSEVRNPFVFPATGMNSIGDGDVLYMSSAVAALSEGQFGQFPLYAFTTEGVWALSVNDNGTYSSIQPVSRDVANNINSITSIDSSVIFGTNRGLMELHGSQSTLVSDSLNRRAVNIISKDAFAYIDILTGDAPVFDSLNIDFRSFLKDCSTVYDYTNQRIVAFAPGYSMAWSLNIKNKAWTMLTYAYAYKINSYPDALLVTADGSLVNVSKQDDVSGESKQASFLLTRPIDFDTPNDYKYLDDVRQNGVLTPTCLKQIVYGSNNLLDWHCIGSSASLRLSGKNGTPFRFFRIAILSALSDAESLDSVTFSYHIKNENEHLL